MEGAQEEAKAVEATHGGEYSGDFANDHMHGNGTFTFPDGSSYVGRFHEGLQHGQGILTLPDGTELVGLWEMGEQVSADYNIDLHDDEGQVDGDEEEAQKAPAKLSSDQTQAQAPEEVLVDKK